MSQSNNQQLKWIALSVLFLFILGGGAYRLSHRGENNGSSPATGASTGGASKTSEQIAQTPSAQGNNQSTSSGSAVLAPVTTAAPTSTSASNAAKSTTAPASSLLSTLTFGIFGKSASTSAPTLGVGTSNTTGTTGETQPTTSETVASKDAPKTETVAAPADQCVTMTYKHKTLASHPDEESCSHHKNILKLTGSDINSKSVCVRVNGTPVHYLSVKGHSDELVFGSVAGPKAKVTVRYCMGKGSECAKFAEECTVPKDEFMEAIGGSAGESKDAKLGQWDPSNPSEKEADVMARLDGEVKKELETNDDLNGRAPAGEMFKDWIGEVQAAPCGAKQASN